MDQARATGLAAPFRLIFCTLLFAGAWASHASAQGTVLAGVVDRAVSVNSSTRTIRTDYSLLTDGNARYQLQVAGTIPAGFGDRGRRWQVTGMVVPPARQGAMPVVRMSAATALTAPQLRTQTPTTLRFATILCHIPGSTVTPLSAATLNRWYGNSYPGWGHWFTTVSGGLFSLQMLGATTYVSPPGNFRDYFNAGIENATVDSLPTPDQDHYQAIFERCAAASDVDLLNVDGVHVVYDQNSHAYFGWSRTWTIKGQSKDLIVMWSGADAYPNDVGTIVGLLGVGWPGGTFSHWNGYVDWRSEEGFEFPLATNRAYSGWIPPSRQLFIPVRTEQKVILTAPGFVGTPSAGSMDYVEINTPTNVPFAIEARQKTGLLEQHIPFTGVLVTWMDGNAFNILDVDHNGFFNDSGSALHLGGATTGPGYRPNPIFDDPAHGIRVELLRETPDGYEALVTSGWRTTVQVIGNGTVSGLANSSCTTTCSAVSLSSTQRLNLVATPTASGWGFRGWSGACTGKGTCTLTTDSTKLAIANFSDRIVIFSDTVLPIVVSGGGYQASLRAEGAGPLTWTLLSGSMPPGLGLNPQTGTITGVIGAAGQYQFTVRMTDGSSTLDQRYSQRVVAPLKLITTDFYVLAGQPFTFALQASGGGGGIRWEKQAALPDSTVLSSDGHLSGTPRVPGDFTLAVQAIWDTLAMWTINAKVSMHVVAAPAITGPATLPTATVGSAFTDALPANVSSGLLWSVISGTLPKGVTLDPDGTLRGRPEESGNFTFTARIQYDTLSAVRTLTLPVTVPDVDVNNVLNALLHGEAVTTTVRDYLDATGNHNGSFDIGDVRAWLVRQRLVGVHASIADVLRALMAQRGHRP